MTDEPKRQPRLTKAGLTRAQINSIADAATAHPLSVMKALNGLPVRGDVGVRIGAVLKEKGIG
jgi:hypothetical protein